MDAFSVKDTYELIAIQERIKPAASFLLDTVFPIKMPTSTSGYVFVESRKQGRRLAPFVTEGAHGVNVEREGSQLSMYKCPLVAPRRTIGINEIEQRVFGEQPVYSSLTPQDRAARLMADDLKDLGRMVTNRKSAMAAELLQTGKITVSGLGDDGRTPAQAVIDYKWTGAQTKNWTTTNATLFKDLKEASETIQENAGLVPTLLICGKNIENYMAKNSEFKQWLFSANANALLMINYQPRYTSPQIRTLGFIAGLNVEMVVYSETYVEGGQVKSFIDPDTCVLCIPGRGKQLSGAVTLLEGKTWQTYSAEAVPHYSGNDAAQVSSLTLYSRPLIVPETVDDWVTIKVAA